MMLFEPEAEYFKKPNLSPAVFELENSIKNRNLKSSIIFTLFSTLISQNKICRFLKIDFRIPFTKDYKLFSKMAKLERDC